LQRGTGVSHDDLPVGEDRLVVYTLAFQQKAVETKLTIHPINLVQCFGTTIMIAEVLEMDVMSYSSFREKLASVLDYISDHSTVVKITRQNGKAAVVMSLEDWERDQETLYVLQSKPLMQQIAASLKTHEAKTGRIADKGTIDEILSI
jgi:antitoxin YefM